MIWWSRRKKPGNPTGFWDDEWELEIKYPFGEQYITLASLVGQTFSIRRVSKDLPKLWIVEYGGNLYTTYVTDGILHTFYHLRFAKGYKLNDLDSFVKLSITATSSSYIMEYEEV